VAVADAAGEEERPSMTAGGQHAERSEREPVWRLGLEPERELPENRHTVGQALVHHLLYQSLQEEYDKGNGQDAQSFPV